MICLECNKKLKQISYRHLKKCCHLSPTEYKNKYNIQILMDTDIRNKCSKKGILNGNYKDGRSSIKRRCIICRRFICKGNKSGYCSHCINRKGVNNGFYKRKHSNITKEIMKLSARKRDKTAYHKIIQTDTMKKNHSDFMKKRWKNVSEKDKDAMIKNWIIKGLESCRKSSKTKIENIMYHILKQLHFKNIKRNIQVGYYNVDFLIDTLIIECFGDYWHCNPLMFDKNKYNKSLRLKAFEKWNKDSKRLNKLKQMGYTCLSFWEYDIYNNIKSIKRNLKNYV